VRERAGRRSITLQTSVDERLGQIQADERKIRQVVLNLLSNAIKFTPEGGRIEVGAVPKDGFVEVSVSDTGVGIAPQDQGATSEPDSDGHSASRNRRGRGASTAAIRGGYSRDSHHGDDRVGHDRGPAEDYGRRVRRLSE